MKCPKCGYLGFETSDRCRNCGYDFSLAVAPEPREELPLRVAVDTGGPLSDFDLGSGADRADDSTLDLDRLIGSPVQEEVVERRPERATHSRAATTAVRTPGDPLPLFPSDDAADAPLTPPRPALPPLSVRRTTPEITRTRPRAVTPPLPVADDSAYGEGNIGVAALHVAPERDVHKAPKVPATGAAELVPASRNARVAAAFIDLVLLGVIDGAVLYLTLALARLDPAAIAALPVIPLLLFFAILDGGYLIAFVAAGGQTIGKMIGGIRVVGEDGRRVDVGRACLRAVGCLLSLLTAGLGYLPALLSADGRAVQDRISGTRVVSAR